jgi:hypothetical protein
MQIAYMGFPLMGLPKKSPNRWFIFIMDNPIEMDNLGASHFRKPPY